MALMKRGKSYWLDVVVHGHRYREPLGTTDWREAKHLERDRIGQLEARASVPTAQSVAYASMDVAAAITAYAAERRAQVSKRMVAYWRENAKPLAAFFTDTRLRSITPAQIAAYVTLCAVGTDARDASCSTRSRSSCFAFRQSVVPSGSR